MENVSILGRHTRVLKRRQVLHFEAANDHFSLKKAFKKVTNAVKHAADDIGGGVKQAGRFVDKNVSQPVLKSKAFQTALPIAGGIVGSLVPGVGTALGAGLGATLSGVAKNKSVSGSDVLKLGTSLVGAPGISSALGQSYLGQTVKGVTDSKVVKNITSSNIAKNIASPAVIKEAVKNPVVKQALKSQVSKVQQSIKNIGNDIKSDVQKQMLRTGRTGVVDIVANNRTSAEMLPKTRSLKSVEDRASLISDTKTKDAHKEITMSNSTMIIVALVLVGIVVLVFKS